MTGHAGPLPAGDERHLKARARVRPVVIGRWVREVTDEQLVEAIVERYFAQLRKQGVRLVDASEVVKFVMSRYAGGGEAHRAMVDVLARFGEGDEGPCEVCGAGPSGRCDPPDEHEGACPHGCSPER